MHPSQPEIDPKTNSRQLLQITRNAADIPLRSTDAGFKVLRARCKQGIQVQNALQIA